LKEIIADSDDKNPYGQISVRYLPGEYEIGEFANDKNIEGANIEVDYEIKTLTDDK